MVEANHSDLSEDILTTEELAQMLHISIPAVLRLADEGQLPAARIDSEFRFSRERIMEWLDLNTSPQNYSDALLAEMEKGEINKRIIVSRLIKPAHIELNIQVDSRDQVLTKLVEISNRTGLVKDSPELLNALQIRENLHSTAFDHEIAMPHPRQSHLGIVSGCLIVIGTTSKGIEFGSLDGQPTRLFVMLAVPVLSLHLQILSRLARIFKDTVVKDKILQADNPAQVITILKEREQILEQIANH